MHELSIAQEIIGIVNQYVPDDKNSVSKVFVKIGKLSNVIVHSLVFCFDAIKTDSNLPNAKLIADEIPIKIYCNNCSNTSTILDYSAYCPVCESPNTKIIAGNELNVTEIELND